MYEGKVVNLSEWIKGINSLNDICRRNPFYYKNALTLFEGLSEQSIDERRRWTNSHLGKTLKTASLTEYGRKIGAGSDISSWPLLEKDTVRENSEAFLTRPAWMSIPAGTSGTTGSPTKLYRSPRSIAVEQAAMDRLLLAKGVDPKTARIADMRNTHVKDPSDMAPPFWKLADDGRRLILSSSHLTCETADAYIEAINKFKPDVLMAYVTPLESFCDLVEMSGAKVSIPLVISSAEVLSSQTRATAKELFDCELIDQYGHGERVAFSYSFNEGEYYFLPGYSHIELKHARSEENFDAYEVIGTSLWNTAMPLVRYRTGDYIRLPKEVGEEEIEDVRFGLRPFWGVEGRSGDYVITPEGAHIFAASKPPCRSCPPGLDPDAPGALLNIKRMQLIQESRDHVRALVVAADDFDEEEEESITEELYLKLPRSVRVEVEKVDEVERTAQGKSPFVIRRSGVE